MYPYTIYHFFYRYHEHKRGGKQALSERYGFFLRVLSGEVGVSDNKINLCVSTIFTGLLGRVIPIELLWSRPTMTSVFRRLAWRSEHVRTKTIDDMKRREPRMLWFLFTDDTGRAHGQNTAFPYTDPHTGSWSVEREMLTVSAYTKKSSAHNAEVNKSTLYKRRYPKDNMGGGGGDHPAEKEIRITVQLVRAVLFWLALWWACGNHKTALICRCMYACVYVHTFMNLCMGACMCNVYMCVCMQVDQQHSMSGQSDECFLS